MLHGEEQTYTETTESVQRSDSSIRTACVSNNRRCDCPRERIAIPRDSLRYIAAISYRFHRARVTSGIRTVAYLATRRNDWWMRSDRRSFLSDDQSADSSNRDSCAKWNFSDLAADGRATISSVLDHSLAS